MSGSHIFITTWLPRVQYHKNLLCNAEQVDVNIVDGEIDGDESRPLGQPKSFFQLMNDFLRIILGKSLEAFVTC